jgi:hypothetical protein
VTLSNRGRTNRWTGATGSDFRIKRDPAKLLGSAVARSTQPLGDSFVSESRARSDGIVNPVWNFKHDATTYNQDRCAYPRGDGLHNFRR